MVSNSFFHRLRLQCPSWTSSLSSSHTFQRSTLSVLNHVDIPTLLSICGREGNFHLGSSLHASIVKKPEFYVPEDDGVYRNSLVVWNSLLSMYTKCGGMVNAFKLFDDMPMKDTVSWNTLISGYLRDGEFDMSFRLLKRMRETNIYRPDKATITTILSGCDSPELCNVARMVHGVVFTNGLEKEITVGNALITSYFKVGFFCSGRQVFDEMCERNVISWTAVISGLAQNELYEHSLNLFVEMRKGVIDPNSLTYLSSITACSGLQAIEKGRQIHGIVLKLGFESDLCIESALMDMYSKCGSVDDAWKLFELAETLDEVSITVILVGFAQNGFEEEAVRIFIKMLRAGLEIDSNVVSAILGVFGADTSLGLGKQIHSLIIKRSMNLNPFVSNGLINMYSKCGDLKDSIKVFARMPIRSSISWNSMIAGFARHGDGSTALELYEKMRSDGVEPTDVTFLSLLHACSHVGLVDKGMEFLDSMEREFGIPPRTEHYACVVDMLGRAGLLHEAESFIKRLPVKPDAPIWQAFLGACSIHGNSQLGKHAAEELLSAVPENPTPYILMANIFSSEGKWKERARAIKRMKEVGVAKETGISWIEVEKKIHSFVVYDRMHPQSETIYWVLKELFGLMRDEGYVPDRRFILYYLDEDEKDST